MVRAATATPVAESVAVYVIRCGPIWVGIPDNARVVVSNVSPGTMGVSEYVKSPLPLDIAGRIMGSMSLPNA